MENPEGGAAVRTASRKVSRHVSRKVSRNASRKASWKALLDVPCGFDGMLTSVQNRCNKIIRNRTLNKLRGYQNHPLIVQDGALRVSAPDSAR